LFVHATARTPGRVSLCKIEFDPLGIDVGTNTGAALF
jgi:hypothetical protein